MENTRNFGSFMDENKKLFKEYIHTRLDIYRLRLIRIFSKAAGYFMWVVLSLFLVFLIIIFLGLVTGFWFSKITGDYVTGFGLATLFVIILTGVIAMFRKQLFVNPIIRGMIRKMYDRSDAD